MTRSMSSLLIYLGQLIEQLDVGACMPMRHCDRARANARIHPRDPGQARVAHCARLAAVHRTHPQRAASLGWTMISAASPRNSSCALSPRSCGRGTSTSGAGSRSACRWSTGSKPPAAQPLDVPVHLRRRQFAVSFLALRDLMRALSAHRDGASINAAAKASGINYRTAQRIVQADAERRHRQLVAVG